MFRIHLILVLIFLLSLTTRLIYVRSNPPSLLPDTYGYYLIGQRIVNGQMPAVNPQRTPGYPLFLQLTYKLAGLEKSEINSPGFWMGAQVSVFIQIVISSLGVLILSWLINRLTKSIGITIVLGLLLITNELAFVWDSVLVVESLATSWLIFSCVWCYLTLIKPTRWRIGILIIFGWLGFLLKPVFVGLPMLWLAFLGIRAMSLTGAKNERRGNLIGLTNNKVILDKLLFFCLLIILPFTYVIANYRNFNYPGINHVRDINLLGRVIKDRLDPTAGEKISPELTSQLSKYLKTNQLADPYLFLQIADPNLLVDDSRQADRNRLKPWVNAIISNNLPHYLVGVIRDLPLALVPLVPAQVPQGPALWKPIDIYGSLWGFHGLLTAIVTPVVLILTVVAIMNWRRSSGIQSAVILLLHLTIWYMLLVTVAFGYGEYARLLTPIQPLVYFLGVWWVNKL